jgi:hypothetical protein
MFKFEYTSDDARETTVTLSTEALTLPEILGSLEDFLRGCGFVFDGHLEIVEEDA